MHQKCKQEQVVRKNKVTLETSWYQKTGYWNDTKLQGEAWVALSSFAHAYSSAALFPCMWALEEVSEDNKLIYIYEYWFWGTWVESCLVMDSVLSSSSSSSNSLLPWLWGRGPNNDVTVCFSYKLRMSLCWNGLRKICSSRRNGLFDQHQRIW
jgi:hypothetical protein